MKKQGRAFGSTRSLVIAAMLTAMSAVIAFFCKTHLTFLDVLRITVENFPIVMSGLLFGPVVSLLIGVATDLLTCLLAGQAPIPLITVGAACLGLISGLIPRFLLRRRGKLQIIVTTLAAHIVGVVLIKTFALYQFFGPIALWRIPLCIGLALLECLLLCFLMSRRSFRRLVGYELATDKSTEETHYDL